MVATFETSDEEGDDVTVTLSDTVNYEIVDGTVVLTEAGAALVNSGQELPAFTLIPSDDSTDGKAVSVEPSVTTSNDAPEITNLVINDFVEDNGSAVEGAVVATFETSDEEGDDVTVTLSDTVNYEIVDGTVVLTEAGAALVNSGQELPAFTLIPSDDSTNGEAVSVEPSVTTSNDAPEITNLVINDFVEDNGSAVEGAVVATFETSDEEGDDVTVTLSDTVNYEIVDGTVVLTQAGADLVNSGQELPAFTLIPNDGTTDGETVSVDPSVETVNDAPEIINLVSNDFTEDDGSAVEGATVATFETFDEDGDEVTVTLSDTVNYALVDGSVVLTQAGADLVNSGQGLPVFTLTPNDGSEVLTKAGGAVRVGPSVTTVNDAPEIINLISNDFTEDDGSAVEGAEVASFDTFDEDGDEVTVTLSDTVNYALVDGTVVLTQAGADLVNSGQELPAFTLVPNDGSTDGETVSVDPSVETVNDAPEIINLVSNDFTEDDGSAVEGATVATFETFDEDGDEVTVTLSDTVNYALVDGTVVLTQAGADLVNSGQELPAFTLVPNDGTVDGETVSVDPSVETVNDAPEIINLVSNDFTEDDGSAVEGATVATFETFDEDGDEVTVTLSDTANYALVDGTVVLTQAGADLVNSGQELPAFTLIPNDGNTDGDTVTVDPSVETVNDAPEIINLVSNDFTEDDGSAVEGATVATFETFDEDGDEVSVTLSDTVNYALVDGTVVLTQAGADLVNSGQELPAFTLIPNDGTTDGDAVSVDPSVTTVNDAPKIINLVSNDFTEDDGSAVEGATVATFETFDEDGDEVTVTLSDTVNYALVDGTVVLTQAGADLVNSGQELPAFTLVPNDGTVNGETVSVDPSVETVNDAPEIINLVSNDFTEDDGSAVEGATVATFATFDEDGDEVTVTLSDTVNYALVDGTVVLTQAGADLVNSGQELPAFTLVPNDGTVDGDAVTVDPSVETVNDVPEIITLVSNDFTEDDGSAVEGATVATFETFDEDGDEVTVTLSDTVNYALVDGTVVLTQAGADLVNSGQELPAFTLIPNDGSTDGETVIVDPSVETVNDAPEIINLVSNDFIEDDGSAVEGATVATFETFDEDGDDVTVTLSDTVNYALVDGTVVLTQAGADLVNSGQELPAFTLIPNDGSTDGETVIVDPSVTTANDAPEIINLVSNDFTEDDGSAVEGATVATFDTFDEDGDEVTATLSDTVNYALVDGTVVLTQAGADLVNSGQDLPAFTLIPNDGNTDGDTVTVDPSVETVNDAPEIINLVSNDFTEDDGSAVEGATVATFETFDEDGDEVSVTLSDTVNYALVDGTVVLTQAGADLVNSGQELPAFTLIPNDGTTDGEAVSVDPSVTTVNDAPEIINLVSNDFTEDDGSAVEGATVATFETFDEDGDEVTVTLSDTVNYALVDGTVVLTQAGADLVNSGQELPAFTLVPNDGTVNGETVSVDPSVETVNDAPEIINLVSNDFTEDDGSAVEGATVATFDTFDEDGDEVTVTLSDTVNYALVDGTVVLTQAGADLVNSGQELPAFTLVPNDGTTDGETVSVDPSVTTVNDAPEIINLVSNDFTEDDGSAVEGATVATFETFDEDGDEVTVTLSDTVNYALVDGTVVLTQAGADLVNSGQELPAFTLIPNDGTVDGDAVSVDPSVETVNDTPEIINLVSNDFTEDDGSAVEGATVATFETFDEDGDDVTVTLSDTVNYALVDGTVVLTQAGADLVNSGQDLPAFTLIPNDGITDGDTVSVDPSVETVNDAPEIINLVSNDFTEDDGSAVEGATVATFETFDEDGDEVTVTLSDTVNYALVDGTVVLTQAGADLVNSGQELPAFTLIPNDGSTDGDTVTVDPSVTTANDAPEIINLVSNDFTEDDGSAVEGATVATFETFDEDGDEVSVTLSDTVNYALVDGTVVLTQAGADLVNSGQELPAFTLIPNDGTTDGETVSVDPSVTTVNDAPEIINLVSNDFTEDDGSAVEGATVATFETFDEDGDEVTVTLSDTVNYALVDGTVVLTQAGADLVNSGQELPAFTLIPNDGTTDGETVSVDPSVTTVNDAPEIINLVSNDFTEDDGSAVEGATVATFETFDEDGDEVTVTLSDTVNYALVDGTVVLTQAGADLVNSGQELPAFTLIPNDGTVDGDAVSVDPSVETVNDTPEIINLVSNDFTEDDGSAVEGATVATFETFDEDGDDVTVTLSDTVNYALVDGTVVLTQAGADLVNSGQDLPAFTLIPNDGITDGDTVSVDPSVETVNDAPEIINLVSNDFTEDDGSAVEGATVATFETFDEDGDEVTVTLSDTVNYALVDGTVVLTQAGADLVNSGQELPAFTLIPNDGSTDGDTVTVDPSVTTANDAPEIINLVSNDFTEDDGSAVEGATVATFETFDEDGDEVSVTLSDTVNYALVDGTVVLTQAGADLVNSGQELPAFTLIPNDGTTDGETVSVDPSVTTVNDAPEIINLVSNDFTEDDGSAVEGATVATFETFDEDGDEVTVTLSDTVNYALVDGTVVLTQAGADLVNSGQELPAFTLIPNDGTTDGETVSVDPSVTTVNDAPEIINLVSNDFTEDDGSAVEGATVATFETFDEDGDDVTVALSDTVNYALVDGTVVLTQAGADLVNSGQELPAFTLIPNDGTVNGETVSVDPSVETVNDAPEIINLVSNDFTEDDGSAVEGATVATFDTFDEDGDEVTVTLSDTVNYALVDGTVVLTQAGADLVNSGQELPAFTLIPNDGTVDGDAVSVDPSVETVNDAPEIINLVSNDFTEDDGSAVEGATVATFETFDEDGDDVTVALSDTVNYALVDGTVVLTQAGADLVNSGQELPAFTLIPNDGTVNGETVSVDPSVETVNDAPEIINLVSNDFTEDDGSAVEGATVATFDTFDEDGDEVTVTLSDTVNYALVDGTVVLTQAGADLVNSGQELPAFTLIPNDGTTDGDTVTVDPSVETVNDAPEIINLVSNDFTEDDGSAVEGATVATFETFDEDGDEVTVTLSDTVNYALVDGTVVLTQAGADLVNSGQELPAFTLIPNDGTVDGDAVSVDPSVETVNDTPEIINLVSNDFTEDDGSAVEGATVATFETFDEDGDDVTVTLSDTVNYALVDGTVVLTQAGADLVNSGQDLPAFTLIPNDGITDGDTVSVDPSVETVNDAPEIINLVSNDFTEDDGSAVEGATVATFETFDEDGDEVTVTLSDTVNYALVDGTVVLTQAGADLVNSGQELPAFTLIPNDGTVNGETVSVDPSVETVNDAPEIINLASNDFTEDDGSAVEGATVATFETFDEDGDEVSVTLSDTVNYALVDGTVVLTQAGADLVNSGQELPAFTLIPNDGATDGDTVTVDPSVETVNDAPEIINLVSNDFTEDDGSAVEGATVATFETFDEDGDDVTVTLSDTVNYALVDGTVVLTQCRC
ncbi:hypothetical protein [Psychromonas sp. KJ10-2]|uniref:hypothetical protein n=1 Tax=Psychromonas sp. KJ10-2 TaxID=3391822 RepID=UPI0039B59863